MGIRGTGWRRKLGIEWNRLSQGMMDCKSDARTRLTKEPERSINMHMTLRRRSQRLPGTFRANITPNGNACAARLMCCACMNSPRRETF
jgi:hypothetical protein